MRHNLARDLNVHGPFALKDGKLSFHTGNARLAQDCKRAKEAGAVLTVHLLGGDAMQEFTGVVEAVELISSSAPTAWDIVMVEQEPLDK
jgi:hypothetical protein